MYQLELDLDEPTDPHLYVDNKVYRLELSRSPGLCHGCAFPPEGCLEMFKDNRCVTLLDGKGVWKAVG